MKILLRIIALALLAALSGCSSAGRLQKFLDALPATDLAKVEASSRSPLWTTVNIATDIAVDGDGLLDVGSAKVTLAIPLVYFDSGLEIAGFKQIPTAKQRAAAEALKAAAKAARAEAAAAKAKRAAESAVEKAKATP